MRLRIAATLLLLLQLQPLGGLALCLAPDLAPATCHDMSPHHLMTGSPAVQAPPHCAELGMCAVPALATPGSARPVAAPIVPRSNGSTALPSLHPVDAVPPPAPPPQA